MAKQVDRRGFIKETLAVTTGAAVAMSIEERVLLAHAQDIPEAPSLTVAPRELQSGKVGKVKISRLICGGNLISGYAHSRDLIYVSDLLKHYFNDDKVMETFRLCETNGVNTAMLKFDPDTVRILKKYWKEQGGKIQWIAQIVNPEIIPQDAEKAIEMGAIGVFTTGQMGDALVSQGRVDLLAKAVETVHARNAIAGISCHNLEVILECEKAGIKPDFYMKTFHHKNYWSAKIEERHDNLFEEDPERTIEVMKNLTTPWIAFKVMAAGAIPVRDGFTYAFENGADFICAGMFDFQVAQDANIAKEVIAEFQTRARPWSA
ncbi:MAG TPA: hypothetical protein PLI09_16875 [Candidatus Hydrogenedentes bacterium]|nr:hypothetical protein [Candidatus Hydrogenedentota bacterium]